MSGVLDCFGDSAGFLAMRIVLLLFCLLVHSAAYGATSDVCDGSLAEIMAAAPSDTEFDVLTESELARMEAAFGPRPEHLAGVAIIVMHNQEQATILFSRDDCFLGHSSIMEWGELGSILGMIRARR
jgi:hypothetical protein